MCFTQRRIFVFIVFKYKTKLRNKNSNFTHLIDKTENEQKNQISNIQRVCPKCVFGKYATVFMRDCFAYFG